MAEDIKSELILILPKLKRFAMVMTRSAPDADDLVQDACLRTIANADKWDREQPLDRWVFRIMRHLWIGEIRKRQVRMGNGQVAADSSDELVQTETAEHILAASQLKDQVAALPGELAGLLMTVSVEGYTYAEAATLFEIPVGTVMSRLHRARKILAENLTPAGEVSSHGY